MEVKDVIDQLEEAPENLREFYIKGNDNKFKFDPTAAVAGLKKNRTDILTEKQKIEERYKDVNLDEYNKWKTDKQKAEDDKLKLQGDWDAKEKSLKDAHQKEIETERTKQTHLMSSLEKQLVTNTTVSALTDAKVIASKIKVLMPHIQSRLKVIEVDGDYVARVMDEHGKVRYQNGSEMTIAQLVAEFKADEAFADCFEAEKANGSGTSQNSQTRKPGATGNNDNPAILNPAERLKQARAVKR